MDDLAFCRQVNGKFGCPPPPKEYCGQFSPFIPLWELYEKDITLLGNTWLYKNEIGMSFSGGRFFSSWPVYELSRFLLGLERYFKERSYCGEAK